MIELYMATELLITKTLSMALCSNMGTPASGLEPLYLLRTEKPEVKVTEAMSAATTMGVPALSLNLSGSGSPIRFRGLRPIGLQIANSSFLGVPADLKIVHVNHCKQ